MKSYFAHSVQAAMSQAREELGPEAVLVTSRRSSAAARELGEYEVVFAAEMIESAPASDPPSVSLEPRPDHSEAFESVLAEVRDLRRHIMRETAFRMADPVSVHGRPAAAEAYMELIAAEIEPDIAMQLVAEAQSRFGDIRPDHPRPAGGTVPGPWGSSGRRLSSFVREEMLRSVMTESTLGVAGVSPGMVALVGPPGAGKTATLVKLAVRHGLRSRKPILLLSLDTLRVGASEQLRSYAAILGAGFQIADNCLTLGRTLEEHRNKDLILIDTPGFTARDLEGGNETSDYLMRREDVQKHLVLPATMRAADLIRTAAAYQAFHPSHLILSRLDETETVGALFSEAVRRQTPISFFTTGQRVPDDLEAATSHALIDRIIPRIAAPVSQPTAA